MLLFKIRYLVISSLYAIDTFIIFLRIRFSEFLNAKNKEIFPNRFHLDYLALKFYLNS